MRLLISLLFVVSLLFAGHDDDKHDKHHFPLDVSYLKLSDYQYEKLVKILKEFKHSRKEFHEEGKETKKEIAKLFLSDTFDKDKFVKLTNMLKSHAVNIQADFFAQMHKLLTPKQKKHFVKYMKEWEVE